MPPRPVTVLAAGPIAASVMLAVVFGKLAAMVLLSAVSVLLFLVTLRNARRG